MELGGHINQLSQPANQPTNQSSSLLTNQTKERTYTYTIKHLSASLLEFDSTVITVTAGWCLGSLMPSGAASSNAQNSLIYQKAGITGDLYLDAPVTRGRNEWMNECGSLYMSIYKMVILESENDFLYLYNILESWNKTAIANYWTLNYCANIQFNQFHWDFMVIPTSVSIGEPAEHFMGKSAWSPLSF